MKILKFLKREVDVDTMVNNMLKCAVVVFLLCMLFCIGYSFAGILGARSLLPTSVERVASVSADVKSSEVKIQDFITIVTGFLALIVGATGIGSYLSFKKILEEEKRISRLREKFEALLIISESSSFDPVTATGDPNANKIYSTAEKNAVITDCCMCFEGSSTTTLRVITWL